MNYMHKLARRLARLRPAAVPAACGRWSNDRKIGQNRAVQHHLVCRTLPILTLVLLLAACADSSAPAAPDAGAVDMYQVGRGWARRLVGIRISPDTAVVSPGRTVAFKASGVLTDGSSRPITVEWVATGGTIDPAGLFTADSTMGTYHVVGTEPTLGLADTAAVVDTTVSVVAPAPAVSSVSVSPTSATLAVGESVQLSATAKDVNGSPVDGSAVTWTTSNSAVASVSSSGVVKALASGSSTVMATIQGVEGKTNITVEATTGTVPGDCGSYPYDRLVSVSTASQLSSAITNAQPGDLIELAAGTYSARYVVSRSGTTTNPVVLCGPRSAVLDAGGWSTTDQAVITMTNASNWTLRGVTIQNALRGFRISGATNVRLTGLEIRNIGQAAIQLYQSSKHNLIDSSYIHDTGKATKEYGEGVYMGTDAGAWPGGVPDRSDSNRIAYNVFGPNIGSDMVDVKPGTTGTVIEYNTLNGIGQGHSVSWNDAWIYIVGNGVLVRGNVGNDAPVHGFHVASTSGQPGWGLNNRFEGNTANVSSTGYGFKVDLTPNVVKCSNTVTNAGSGYSNIACTP
jgi:hypothetical protein